jgi:hypothetical protein
MTDRLMPVADEFSQRFVELPVGVDGGAECDDAGEDGGAEAGGPIPRSYPAATAAAVNDRSVI